MSTNSTYQYILSGSGVPIPFKVVSTYDQTIYNGAISVIQPYVQKCLHKAFKYEEQGDVTNAKKFFRDANYFYFVLNYLYIVYRYKTMVNQNPSLNVTGQQINEKFNYDCVFKGLSCATCEQPIQQAFTDISEIFGLNTVTASDPNTATCVGIGKMIIGYYGDNADFTSFDINNICTIKSLNQGLLLSSFDLPSFDTKSFEQTQY